MAEPKTIKVKIKGTRPLLMHSPDAIGAPKSTKRSSTYDPETEATACLYKMKDGTIYVPSMAILGCLREAGKEHKAPGRGKKSLSKFLLSGLRIEPDEIPIQPQTWDIDARPVVVQRSRVMRWRPKFNEWTLEFNIKIMDDSVIEPTNLRNVLEDAGRFVGLLDFRPFFGTFEIESMVDVGSGKDIK